jgi:hypothetical protein
MLRLTSIDELAEAKARRERFQRGQIAIPERDVLAGILALLKRHPLMAMSWRMNTAAGYVIDARKYHALVAAGALKATDARFMRFAFKGCSDVIGVTRHGQFVAIEAKSDRGELTDDQAAFIDSVRACGGLSAVCRSVDEAARVLGAP